ncbi:MAG: plasmid pRiA4b ORF-3 family protein [Firmicutes bacterium]|nr:plasmid pRiA4b ORF-3 family protein [Bacillota bacterium]
MKAYQIKIELSNSEPLIWRRVVVPAQITFSQLHAVIQNSLNFKGLYVYTFDFPDQNLKVTNDDEAYKLYEEYRRDQEELEKVLGALGTSFAKKQLAAISTKVQKPEALKIDAYLQEVGRLEYKYSVEDNWVIFISLEQVVEDYNLSHPSLLAGEQAAPPEDVRGLAGFYEFLEVYRDPNHPDYQDAQIWGEKQDFRDYDAEYINSKLSVLNFGQD